MSVSAKSMKSINVVGEWIARDHDRFIVNVPCQGGRGYFYIKELGGTVAALKAARAFHVKMCKQLVKDREYFSEYGEKPQRTVLNIRNRSGYTGIARHVHPNLDGRPLITFTAYYSHKGRQLTKYFSSIEFKHEEYALEAAIKWRKEMIGSHKGHR